MKKVLYVVIVIAIILLAVYVVNMQLDPMGIRQLLLDGLKEKRKKKK